MRERAFLVLGFLAWGAAGVVGCGRGANPSGGAPGSAAKPSTGGDGAGPAAGSGGGGGDNPGTGGDGGSGILTGGTAGSGNDQGGEAGDGQGGRAGMGAMGGAGTGGMSGASGSGGAMSAGAGGDAGSGSASGGGGAAGAGGAKGSGFGKAEVEPRVLVVDPAANRLEARDREGVLVRNYVADLELGSDYANRSVAADTLDFLPWDGTEYASAYLSGTNRGLAEAIQPSRIIIRADATTGTAVKIKLLTVSGAVAAEHPINGAWPAFQISPRRGYLHAVRRLQNDVKHAAVFRVADGDLVWEGDISSAAFTRDDSRYVFVPADYSAPVTIVDLATGVSTTPTAQQLPFTMQPGTILGVEAALNDRAVIGGYVTADGLWSVDWQGNVRAFDEAPARTDAYFNRFDAVGRRALWSRQTQDPPVTASFYVTDLASMMTSPWAGPAGSCFDQPTLPYFTVESGALRSCSCSDESCSTIATIPVVANWYPQLTVSRDHNVVMVNYSYFSGSRPPMIPSTLCFTASGELLATIAGGSPELDQTGQVVLNRETYANYDYTVVNLVTGNQHPLGRAEWAGFIYE